jgi:hypothetical protein
MEIKTFTQTADGFEFNVEVVWSEIEPKQKELNEILATTKTTIEWSATDPFISLTLTSKQIKSLNLDYKLQLSRIKEQLKRSFGDDGSFFNKIEQAFRD